MEKTISFSCHQPTEGRRASQLPKLEMHHLSIDERNCKDGESSAVARGIDSKLKQRMISKLPAVFLSRRFRKKISSFGRRNVIPALLLKKTIKQRTW